MSQYIANQLVFSDESAYDRRTLSRRYSWSFLGHRAQKFTFFVQKKRFTIEGALCINGLLAYSIQEGSMNTQDYENFIENVLVRQRLHDLCQEKGVKLEFLPPYSPDYNPYYLRQNQEWAESVEDPLEVLDLTCMTISTNLACTCFQHSGYLR
ncbi:6441_t:CDS:2 [Dentiscutata heterogama]|uniref:6441_t:CDS:1 n=1 Tax=Dentiscutata heterogama TaxID=1316150 RepID=A0ACA9LMB0_9GLOM|nr:6441_t:CDS:2 [Dentiscutata heterogama]